MEKQIGFKIIGIRTEQFATIEDNLVEKKKIEVLTDLEYKGNTESNQIGAFVTFTFNAAKKPFIILQVSCHFQIAEDSWKECVGNTHITFPRDFMIHLAMITIGSARGILHSKTEGTSFNKFLLPTINVHELVKEDIVFNSIN
ncbi:hypothetical protein M9Q43_05645 [Flavobacterium sp. HXWNR29]|uniref:hypothetical protein n=1 Tax=Flavobacterium odoriferum TaxID=2946604 RepID=UPI0021CB3A2E|nr:hypothetical protein [Flavobacterium sp. HXWNR29]MCU4188647.1 hypothetical protein [Flavobacterium sp. HXWNR29]